MLQYPVRSKFAAGEGPHCWVTLLHIKILKESLRTMAKYVSPSYVKHSDATVAWILDATYVSYVELFTIEKSSPWTSSIDPNTAYKFVQESSDQV